MIILILLICGLGIGLMSSFFGIGGGALMVPILYWLFPEFSSPIVISTSLMTIFFMTSFNSYYFFKNNYYENPKTVIFIMISTLIGGYTGGLFTYYVDTEISKKVLGVILLLSIARSLYYRPPAGGTDNIITWKLFLTGLLGALLSSLTGLGGGIVFVPMLLSFVMLNGKFVSAYSNLMMMSATLMGSIPHLLNPLEDTSMFDPMIVPYFLGQTNFAFVGIFFISGIFAARMGFKLNHLATERQKKLSFALLLIVLAIKLFVS